MQSVLRIALRNTTRQRKRSITLASAIAFGVMVITLINAFTAGMVENLKENFSFILGGHIYISGTELTKTGRVVNAISDNASLEAALVPVAQYIQKTNRRSDALVELVFNSRTTYQQVSGVDWHAEPDLPSKLIVVSGSLAERDAPDALVLPQPAAEDLGVTVGETVLAKLDTITGQRNVGEFRVVAITKDQTNFGVAAAYLPLQTMNDLLGLTGADYQLIHLVLNDINDMDHVADTIYAKLDEQAEVQPRLKLDMHMGGFDENEEVDEEDKEQEEQMRQALNAIMGGQTKVDEPWEGTKFAVATLNDIMSPVMSMVGVLNTVSLVVFFILLVITMVGIMNTFRMILIERTREIGTMRALGMQRHIVRNIFLSEALILGVAGALAGLVLAGLVMLIMLAFRFDNAAVLQFFLDKGRFSFRIIPAQVLTNLALLMAMTLFAAYLPARTAARLHPADALRAQF